MRRKKLPLPIRLLIVLMMLAALAFAAIYQGLVTRRYTIQTDTIAPGERIRIVSLTDLHSTPHGGDMQPLIERVRALSPDLICMVGDMADGPQAVYGYSLLLSGIEGLAPLYYVTGNHEYYNDLGAIFDLLDTHGVTVLRGASEAIEIRGQSLLIAGVDDPIFSPGAPFDALLAPFLPLPEDQFTLLLSHRPEGFYAYGRAGFSLVLAGHAHGGQVRVPLLLNGLWAPDQGWIPKLAGGKYQTGETTMVVSRGLSIYDNLPRIFNPPEVVVVDLVGE